MLLFTAFSISSSVFPIPAKTILSFGKCLRAKSTSPPETQSAPISGCDANKFTTFTLKFDFNEKCIFKSYSFDRLISSSTVSFNKEVL